MDTKKKRSGGFGSIFFMIIIIGIVWAVIAQMSQRTSNYKYKAVSYTHLRAHET